MKFWTVADTSDDKRYRPEIDGLRAIAVLSVLLFHLGFQEIPGGFLGVDIFFVISGYVITRLIAQEIRTTGRFNVWSFYIRRARRLFPAMLTTFAICFVVGFVLLSPYNFQHFAGSLATAVGSLSNFYFWTDNGYFEISGQFRPLLHTWSLGVEVQFYLVWPFVVALLVRQKRTMRALLILTFLILLNVLLNHVFLNADFSFLSDVAPHLTHWLTQKSTSIFYLTPFRVFEFMIGAAMVWCEKLRPTHLVLREFFPAAGGVMILLSVVFLLGDAPFLFYKTLIPCIGAAFIIFADNSRVSRVVLGNRLMVGLGLISYSQCRPINIP